MKRLATCILFPAAAVLCAVAPASLRAESVDPARALAARVEHRAQEIAARRIAAPDRFSITAVRFGGADPVPAGAVELEPEEIDGPSQSGTIRIAFRVLVDGTPRGRARATVRGEVWGPVLVAQRTLSYDDPILPTDVKVEDRELTRLGGEPVRDFEQLDGRVPLRSLGGGRPITDDLLGPASVVHRNEPVDLRVRRGALTVTARGLAKTDGAPGDLVPAVNVATGTRLVGRVQEDGSLLVLRGAVGSSRR